MCLDFLVLPLQVFRSIGPLQSLLYKVKSLLVFIFPFVNFFKIFNIYTTSDQSTVEVVLWPAVFQALWSHVIVRNDWNGVVHLGWAELQKWIDAESNWYIENLWLKWVINSQIHRYCCYYEHDMERTILCQILKIFSE